MTSDDANETVKPEEPEEAKTESTEEEDKNMEEEQKADEPAPEETSDQPDQTTSREAPEKDEDDDDDDDDEPSKNASGDLEEDVTMTFPQRVSIVVCSSLSHCCCCCQVVSPRQVSFLATGAFSPVYIYLHKGLRERVFRNRNVWQMSHGARADLK
jgi:hypothetical protein